MKRRTEQDNFSRNFRETRILDAALVRLLKLICGILISLMFLPSFLNAQEDLMPSPDRRHVPLEQLDQSGAESEDAVQPSGGQAEAIDLSAGDESDLFPLPNINQITDEELLESQLSVGEEERTIFNARPYDPFYEQVVSEASRPDITRLGPLPEILEEGVKFTDVAGDWIYYQKSAGLTEIRGHCMVIYETTIISSDEAILDEKNEIYRFFGEGRVFVDDADFTLECDELEIHDAEGEKTVYIIGQSTLLVYADEDAEEPGEDSTRRDRLTYALKQHDTIITFTDAEYDYENDIFDAHNGVRFEQPDKYAEGGEFHGENETEYVLFTGNCEFWQQDGLWLYEHRVVEDKEDPPSRGDKITRALLSVPTTITCDEFESNTSSGWLQMRSEGDNVVYFKQDDKHAECDYFTLFFTDSDKEDEGEEEISDEPRNLLEPEEVQPEEPEEDRGWIKPPGYGTLRLASEYPSGYIPWGQGSAETGERIVMPGSDQIGIAEWGQLLVLEEPPDETTPDTASETGFDPELFGLSDEAGDRIEQYLGDFMNVDPNAPHGELTGDPTATGPSINDPFNEQAPSIPGETPPVDAIQEPDIQAEHDSMDFLTQREDTEIELVTEGIPEDFEGGRDEIFMHGNVFIRQENGDWLFDYDIVDEEEETEENIEQYRKWANGSCDMLHVWTVDEIVEAIGSVYGEQDNQNLATDFAKYIADLDMVYLNGHVAVNREGKHSLLSNEAFMFLTTNIFEALGNVQTRVMVDVEEQRDRRNQEEAESAGETQPETE